MSFAQINPYIPNLFQMQSAWTTMFQPMMPFNMFQPMDIFAQANMFQMPSFYPQFGYNNMFDNSGRFSYPAINYYMPSVFAPQNNNIVSPKVDNSSANFGSLTSQRSTTEALDNDGKGALNLSDKELSRLGFNNTKLKERWKHLNPKLQRALVKLVNYAEKNNIKISYNSTFRTNEEQKDLKRRKGSIAATPGHSPHEKGWAVDLSTTSINGSTRTNRENQALLGAYWESLGYRWGGHFQNFAKEPWHFDIKQTRS